jgi:arginyl-tRNA--protein-N-Asp/Glu arginylyltransferase
MVHLLTFTSPPHECGYLPNRLASLQYEVVAQATPAEYLALMKRGWRRFGHQFFRPVCESCSACRSLRVPVASFRPDRSQRRAAAANADTRLVIGSPEVTAEKLDLYDRFHAFQSGHKGWPDRGPKDTLEYAESFTENPFPTEEWCYYRGGQLTGVGYVDHLPEGYSAIYFFYDPAERDRSPGTFNVLSILRRAAELGYPHVYLGYYVEGCRSLEYKARFQPNEVFAGGGDWVPFLG